MSKKVSSCFSSSSSSSFSAAAGLEKRKVIQKENITRLIRDVKDVLKHPLQDNGIYYKHDETDMLQGYAMIVGPAGTPYEDGFFLFSLQYPVEYPYLPPTVTYCTNGKNVRFHPNLYIKGKVCLSMLNTWQGEQWTSCETIRSVLLQLVGLFHALPLLNEPGVELDDPEVAVYNRVVEYATYDIAIGSVLRKDAGVYHSFFDLFYEEMQGHFRAKRGNIMDRLQRLVETNPVPVTLEVEVFEMVLNVDYASLFAKIQTI